MLMATSVIHAVTLFLHKVPATPEETGHQSDVLQRVPANV